MEKWFDAVACVLLYHEVIDKVSEHVVLLQKKYVQCIYNILRLCPSTKEVCAVHL